VRASRWQSIAFSAWLAATRVEAEEIVIPEPASLTRGERREVERLARGQARPGARVSFSYAHRAGADGVRVQFFLQTPVRSDSLLEIDHVVCERAGRSPWSCRNDVRRYVDSPRVEIGKGIDPEIARAVVAFARPWLPIGSGDRELSLTHAPYLALGDAPDTYEIRSDNSALVVALGRDGARWIAERPLRE
jgi:hypothetical protein